MSALLLFKLTLAAAGVAGAPSRSIASSGSTTFDLASAKDFVLAGGAAVTNNGMLNLRSGSPDSTSIASVSVALSPGITVDSITFSYRYCFGPPPLPAHLVPCPVLVLVRV